MFSTRDYAEKRDYIRMEVNCPLNFSENASSKTYEGTCINLSAKGIAFEANTAYPIGTTLFVEVAPKLAVASPFTAMVKIIRSEQNLQNKSYRLAGTFEEIC